MANLCLRLRHGRSQSRCDSRVGKGARRAADYPHTEFSTRMPADVVVCVLQDEGLEGGTLRNFGLKVGMVGMVRFEARIQELVETIPDLAILVEPLLVVRRALREQIIILHRRLLAIVRDDEVCRRLMTTPGVGPVVALTYRATVDVPARFRKSKSVGAVFGLTSSRYQSGEIDWSGRISRCGDEMMRVMLYEAAQSMLHSKKWSWLKAWAMQIWRRRGYCIPSSLM